VPEVPIHSDLQIRQNLGGKQKIHLHDLQPAIYPGLNSKGNQKAAALSFLRPLHACLHAKRYLYTISMFQLPRMQNL